MSAFAGLGVTDAEVEVIGAELPALDGAAASYVEGLISAGLEACGTLNVRGPYARVFYRDEAVKISIGSGEGHWEYRFVTAPERFPGEQVCALRLDPESYAAEIAPARTFAFEEEIGPLRAAGLGLGLDERSALVLGLRGYNNPPKYVDEPARHKLLDLLGDLYLSGVPPILLNVVAERSGHTANVKAAARLAEATEIERRK